MDYEKNIKELNDISSKLADEKLPLEESVKLYERAEKLYKECGDYLTSETGRVYKIKQQLDQYNEEKMD